MDLGLAPPAGTINLIIMTALITAIVTLLSKRFTKFLLRLFVRPFVRIKEWIYKWIAPRNPFSIALRSYKKHVLRSELARIENPVGPSLDVPLEHAYAPLKLLSGRTQEGVELFSHAAENNRFIVLGGPGTGKTTLMKCICISVLKRHCVPELNDLIPVFVKLRKLAANKHSVEEAIVASFDHHHFPGAEKFIKSALSQGKLLIVLDGLDEVGASRQYVSTQIREFCQHDDQQKYKNRVIVTCRENSYRTQDLRSVIPNIVRVEPFANFHIRTFLQGWPIYKDRSALKLYSLIQSDPQIRDICRNPLLLTILTGLYMDAENFELPTSRDRFYKASIKELLDDRPARRGIEQKFTSEEKQQVIERVSLERLETAQSYEDPEEFSRESIRLHAEKVLRREFDLNELLKELVVINGLIKPGGDDTFTCAHRTIQEYLAAREARRTRVIDEVLNRFGSRPDLIEVLYFYCGLINNIPQLTLIVEKLSESGKWLETGRCLLNMTEVLDQKIIDRIAYELLNQTKNTTGLGSGLELLSSLAQRPPKEFESARKYFSEAIDLLSKSYGAKGASALESALATSPEAAMQVIPGLLNHSSQSWQSSAVRLLRDIGTDEALDQLVQLLESKNTIVKSEAAKALAGLIKSRREDLIKRSSMLSDRKDPEIWPLEKFFPGRLALRITEPLVNVTETGNRAIDCAVKALKAKKTNIKAERSFIRQWNNITRDQTFRYIRMSAGKFAMKFGFIGTLSLYLIIMLIMNWTTFANKILIVEMIPLRLHSLDATSLIQLRNDADGFFSALKERYPPKASGLSRVLPWNWYVEPIIPDSSSKAFEIVNKFTSDFFNPYILLDRTFDIKKLSNLVADTTFSNLKVSVYQARQYLPNLQDSIYLTFLGNKKFILTFLTLPIIIVIVLFSTLVFPKRFKTIKRKSDPFTYYFFISCFFFTVVLSVVYYVRGTLFLQVGFPLVLIALVLIGKIIHWTNWPVNPLISVIDEVSPIHASHVK